MGRSVGSMALMKIKTSQVVSVPTPGNDGHGLCRVGIGPDRFLHMNFKQYEKNRSSIS
jgi:hypothetical protein